MAPSIATESNIPFSGFSCASAPVINLVRHLAFGFNRFRVFVFFFFKLACDRLTPECIWLHLNFHKFDPIERLLRTSASATKHDVVLVAKQNVTSDHVPGLLLLLLLPVPVDQ